eukprot:9466239-Pyramimonas_sp.AAC.1
MQYLAQSGREAFGRCSCAVARGAVALERQGCAMPGAASFLGDAEAVRGAPADPVQNQLRRER